MSLYFRIEQQFQNVLALWHESHVNMKSVVSWHYLTNEIEAVRAGNVASVSAMSREGPLSHLLGSRRVHFPEILYNQQFAAILIFLVGIAGSDHAGYHCATFCLDLNSLYTDTFGEGAER